MRRYKGVISGGEAIEGGQFCQVRIYRGVILEGEEIERGNFGR